MGRPKGSLNKAHVEKIKFVCEWCGQGFERWPAHIRREARRGGRVRFCSRECASLGRDKSWVKKGSEHPRWKGNDYRRIALEHYGSRCLQCGYEKYPSLLWVHHKDFGRTDHSLENLEVLCIRCHLELHLEHDAFQV